LKLATFDWGWAAQIALVIFTGGLVVFAAYCVWDNTKYLKYLQSEHDNRDSKHYPSLTNKTVLNGKIFVRLRVASFANSARNSAKAVSDKLFPLPGAPIFFSSLSRLWEFMAFLKCSFPNEPISN